VSFRNSFCTAIVITMLGFPLPVASQTSAEEIHLLQGCSKTAELISQIQGSEASSPLINEMVEVEAVVTDVFQQPSQWGGFFLQEQNTDSDGDESTSEGLFIRSTRPVEQGNIIRVRGRVTENKGQTELDSITAVVVCEQNGALPDATELKLPVASAEVFESLEGMRVTFPQNLVISDLYGLSAKGEILVSGSRLFQPTHMLAPGHESQTLAQANGLNQLIVDDGHSETGRSIPLHGQDNTAAFSASNPLRNGQNMSGLVGILHYSAGVYRVQSNSDFKIDPRRNPRPESPDLSGGSLRIAVFNVLNFFSTVDGSGPICGPGQNVSCRGADSHEEKTRQLDKLLSAIRAIDADVLGLVELENNEQQSLEDIVAGLNASDDEEIYRYLPTGSIGEDAIKVGLIYKPNVVSLTGKPAILNASVDKRFDDSLSRPALAQTFQTNDQHSLTVIVTHLKSKRCKEQSGPDTDQGDGQGCFNHSRSKAAAALADWSLADPTGTDPENILLMGDFNSHRMEDPIRIMQEQGLVNLMTKIQPKDSYTHSYNGLAGSLDHIFVSPQLEPLVGGIMVWHINADESGLLDYNNDNAKPESYYRIDPYRTSDHDPIIVDFSLGNAKRQEPKAKIDDDDKSVMVWIVSLFLLLLAYLRSRRRL
jgi:predicted extracellular nuclease